MGVHPVKRLLRNPWLWIFLPLPLLFGLFQIFSVSTDTILLTLRLLIFVTLSIHASKYVLRAPVLIIDGNVASESVWLVGWAVVLLSLMATQVLGWVSISLERPDWLTAQYWGSDIVLSLLYGLLLMVWGSRRTTPRPATGRLGFGGFVVGFLSALGLMLSGVLPSLTKAVLALFGGLMHAL
jgi:hypothetical protein